MKREDVTHMIRRTFGDVKGPVMTESGLWVWLTDSSGSFMRVPRRGVNPPLWTWSMSVEKVDDENHPSLTSFNPTLLIRAVSLLHIHGHKAPDLNTLLGFDPIKELTDDDIPQPGEVWEFAAMGSNDWYRATIGNGGAFPKCRRRRVDPPSEGGGWIWNHEDAGDE
jgi:hypothetical protein